MKKEIFGVIICVIIVLIIVVSIWVLYLHPKNKTISDIKKLSFHYTDGYAINAYVDYELTCEDVCSLKYKPNGVPEEDAKTVSFPKEDVSKIIDVLNKYNVSRWDGFDRNAKDILDGDSFSFKVVMDDKNSIYASGYMLWPKNYREVKKELEDIFYTVIK